MIPVNKESRYMCTFEDEDKEIFEKKKVVQCEVFTLKQQKEKSIYQLKIGNELVPCVFLPLK